MATFSLNKLTTDLRNHPFKTHGIQLVVEEIEERKVEHPVFGALSTGIRSFEVRRSIFEQFVEEIQSDLETLRKQGISKYGIFIHSYVTAKNHEVSDDAHMMRYTKATCTKQLGTRVQA